MKPYLLGQGVFHFVDGSVSCPPFHVSDSSAGSSSTISPSFLHWKQQDQLILSALLSSLSVDVLHLVVDCSTSHCVWRTLEKMLASPSNSRIMQLHGSFPDLRQGDSSVSIYMQQVKRYLTNSVTTPIVRSVYPFNFHIKGKWSLIFFCSPKFLMKFWQSLLYIGRSQVIDNLPCTHL
jgi:hypothetical protein